MAIDDNTVYGLTGAQVKGLANEVNAKANISAVPTKTSDLTNDSGFQTLANVNSAVGAEASARQGADTTLQSQIDAIVAASDVKDVVGTKAALNNYDTTALGDNDIIKVLADESQSNATTYYRWSVSGAAFTLIGSEGPYYTKSQTDTLVNAKADASTTYTKSEVDTALSTKANSSSLSTVATSGSYNDLSNKPTIPEDKIVYVECTLSGQTSSGFTVTTDKTVSEVASLIQSGKKVTYRLTLTQSIGGLLAGVYEFEVLWSGAAIMGYAVGIIQGAVRSSIFVMIHSSANSADVTQKNIPELVSDLTNDAGYQTASDVSTAIAGKANTADLSAVATSGSYNDLTNKPTIPTVGDGVLTIKRNGSQVLSFHANATSNSSVNIIVPEITMTTTDPGEGSALAANNFIAVYTA